ncbi:site-specific integrase [Bacillus cereus group sp. LD113LC]|uniref:site-specific integrase n=1 Tax=unclassified Bacillus cereus group TaxID=2750818 RepID=UPI0022E230FE|nr:MULTISPECIES: site-specific integrase [unclassified Bacillus cereus group]MDA1539068.1 site-specific integrase [Bacillus cereus group sp. TH244-1LC]MDA1622201.1 site-specific integrase [Bacillus cereus group sp. TH206-1LC]MDA1749493.1 site-specific integrase [Bacillus cereus group sp. LD113LC]
MSVMDAVKEIELDIDVFSDEGFDLKRSVIESKEIIQKLEEEKRWLRGEFEEDYWEVSRNIYNERCHGYDFSKFDSAQFNHELPKEFKTIVKCWIINLIDKYKEAATHGMIHLTKGFEITKGFKTTEIKTLEDYIELGELTHNYRRAILIALCNFFDYADLEIADDYLPTLVELKDKMPKRKSNVRKLPTAQYALSFSYYLEKHFENLMESYVNQENFDKELLMVYPLIIWWRLTTIIPMRSSEFCLLERKCLDMENDKCYIKLPRIKQNTKRIQIMDKVAIDEEMYQLIKRYIDLTNQYGKTETLISYRSIMSVKDSNRGYIQKNLSQFNRANLEKMITRFYRTIEQKYNFKVEQENQLRPNDTRHIAFMSLMMQGYSPVEIARLGGHTTIHTQLHYSNHKEYWVDCEVFKLMKKVKNTSLSTASVGAIPDEVKLKAYGNEGTYKQKMNIGFCKDEEQKCESKRCYFCSHWGIELEEYLEKKDAIQKEILEMRNNVNEMTAALQNLNKQFLQDELSRRNPEMLTKIKTKSNAIQSDIYRMALLSSKLEEMDGGRMLHD